MIISGGTLSTNGTGVIRSVVGDNFSDGFAPILDGVSNGALTNSGTVELGATDKLVITGTINNSGTIRLLGNATQGATLFIDQNTTLQGEGSLVLSDSGSNVIEADRSGSTLDNFQSIAGAGFIDVDTDVNRSLTFQNDGIISATGTNALVFEANLGPSPGEVINNGLMEAFGAGGFIFANALVANSSGIIQANNGSQVDLGNRSVIFGGMLATVGTGVIRSIGHDTASSPGPRLDTITNHGTIEIDGDTSLTISGTINSTGTIKLLGSATQNATLFVDLHSTLQGTGSVLLSDSSSNVIEADRSGSTLDNRQSISGAGLIEVDTDLNQSLIFQNDGIVRATGINALVFAANHGSFPGQVINNNLMEAVGTGGLVFLDAAVTNNNGLIEANAGSQVDFLDAALSGTGGLLFIDPNATATFSNSTAGAGQIIQFVKGANETLVLDDATVNSTTIGAHISGFAIGDKIDLTQLKVTSASIDGSARLHLFSGTTEIGSLQLDSGNLGERFVVTGDGGAGTLLTIGAIAPPQVTESLAHDTGAKANDGITNDPSLAGTGDALAVVSFSEGGINLGTTVADATGAWHFTPTNLSQGSHTIIASETNGAGTGHANLAFTYDSLAPNVAITTPDALVANPLLTLSGTGEAGTQVQLFDNAASTGGLVTVDATGHWSEQITLVGTGTHLIQATDTDLAGNVGGSALSTFALDNQIVAPVNQLNVAGTTGPDHITISQSNILVGAGAGNDTITLTPGGNFQFHFLNGGPGNDTLDLSHIAGNVTANLAQDTLTGSQVGFSVLNSIENIIAGTGNERLIGSSGANVLQAGAGNDTITGDGGGDTFVFKPGFGKTVITDFHVATTNANPHDLIELDHSLFSQFATVQALLASAEVTQSGPSVVIAADPTHTIELQHTSLRTLVAHANDVLFV
jgi:Ca2+-binding RTX toxin-like protein